MSIRKQFLFNGAIALIIVLFGASFALAGGGPRDHTGGFFLRLSGGGGSSSTSLEDAFDKLELSGPAGNVNFAIGAIVSPNLAIHGTLWGWLVADPDVTFNGVTGTATNVDLSMNAFGAGLTYYFMPVNIYLSGSIGVGVLSIDAGGFDAESDAGLVLDLTLGKEWWVGNNWGLGVAIAGGIHSIPEKNISENWSGGNIAIRFTATMN